VLRSFDRPGKIRNISILTLDRKATMIQLTFVKLATRYTFVFLFYLQVPSSVSAVVLNLFCLKVQKFCQPSKFF